VVNGVVFVGSGDNVYALKASTGAKLWSFATGGVVESSPAVANGVVYVGSEDGNVYALKASTGANVSALPRSPLFSITRSLFSPRVCVSRYQAVTTPGKVFSGDPDFRTRLSVP
jgi:outer membrane protein assembly factor BamB